VTTRFDEDATIEDVVVACANALKIAEAEAEKLAEEETPGGSNSDISTKIDALLAMSSYSTASSSAFYTLVPIRPRWRGERRSLRTFAVVSLRPHLAFNPRPRRLSTPPDAFELHPDVCPYGMALSFGRRGRATARALSALRGEQQQQREGGVERRRRVRVRGVPARNARGVRGRPREGAFSYHTGSHTTPFAW